MAAYVVCCANCEHYDLRNVLSKSGAILKRRTDRCLWQPPAFDWPVSIPEDRRLLPRPMWMQPYDGANCPCFVKRAEEAA